MRPRKKIILAGDSADDLGRFSLVLTANGYRVTKWLPGHHWPLTPFEGAILFCSGDGKVDVGRARHLQLIAPGHVLALTRVGHAPPLGTDQFFSFSSTIQMADFLALLSIFTARKLGPRKGHKNAISTLSTGVIHSIQKTVDKGA